MRGEIEKMSINRYKSTSYRPFYSSHQVDNKQVDSGETNKQIIKNEWGSSRIIDDTVIRATQGQR
jgi:hypothetical protein